MKVAFDVDDTLIKWKEQGKYNLNFKMIEVMDKHFGYKNDIYVWSGGGVDYARHICRMIGVDFMVTAYIVKEKRDDIDICFDDQVVDLAKRNIQI